MKKDQIKRYLLAALALCLVLALAACTVDQDALQDLENQLNSIASSLAAATQPSTTVPVSTGESVTKPSETQVTDPVPTQTVPSDPPATEPKPTEPKPTQPMDPGPYIPLGNVPRQGLAALEGKANAATLVAAYQAIAQAVEQEVTTVSFQDIRLRQEDAELVFHCYHNDHPQHFWLGNSMKWAHDGTYILSLELSYTLSGAQLQQARKAWDGAVDAILSRLKAGMSDFERERVIHDAIILGCDYASGTYAHSAYGALVDGKAVCEGYAKAFQYLLHRADIPSMLVFGRSGGQDHAWNMVCIGGRWYHADITQDDPMGPDGKPGDGRYYNYFNLSEQMIRADHEIGVAYQAGMEPDPFLNYLPLPKADSMDQNYHTVNGSRMEKFDAEAVGKLLKNTHELHLYITGDLAQFSRQLSENWAQVLQYAGKNCNGAIRSYGAELVIVLNET